jgi:hypothetical protein
VLTNDRLQCNVFQATTKYVVKSHQSRLIDDAKLFDRHVSPLEETVASNVIPRSP